MERLRNQNTGKPRPNNTHPFMPRSGRNSFISKSGQGGLLSDNTASDPPFFAPAVQMKSNGKGKDGPMETAATDLTPAAAPSTLAEKKVKVNVTYLTGGSTSLSSHLTKANSIFEQAKVKVESGKVVTLDEAKSKAILGDDLILDEYSDPASATAEEKELLKVNRTADAPTMYYVGGMSAGSLGEAFWPATGNPSGFVYASSNSRTWPHELGHVLLNDGGHPGDADNFMAQTSVASGMEKMTAHQIATIRSSAFVH